VKKSELYIALRRPLHANQEIVLGAEWRASRLRKPQKLPTGTVGGGVAGASLHSSPQVDDSWAQFQKLFNVVQHQQ
jgi:hypothetical protein